MQQITLRAVDGVTITTIVDNVSDGLLADQELATRAGWGPQMATSGRR